MGLEGGGGEGSGDIGLLRFTPLKEKENSLIIHKENGFVFL